MIDLLRAIGERGESALRRGLWSFAGVGFIILTLGFLTGALVEFLAASWPRYAALGAGAAFPFIIALICFARAQRQHARQQSPAAASALSMLENSGDWKLALQVALIDEARTRPARAAALAALAGLVLGVLDGLEGKRAGCP